MLLVSLNLRLYVQDLTQLSMIQIKQCSVARDYLRLLDRKLDDSNKQLRAILSELLKDSDRLNMEASILDVCKPLTFLSTPNLTSSTGATNFDQITAV